MMVARILTRKSGHWLGIYRGRYGFEGYWLAIMVARILARKFGKIARYLSTGVLEVGDVIQKSILNIFCN